MAWLAELPAVLDSFLLIPKVGDWLGVMGSHEVVTKNTCQVVTPPFGHMVV